MKKLAGKITMHRSDEHDSCREKVRELEAEAKVHIQDGMTQRVRAEKAEAIIRQWKGGESILQMLTEENRQLQARAEKAEKHAQDMLVNISERDKAYRALNARHGECQARVAELRKQIHDARRTVFTFWPGEVPDAVAEAVTAHEREDSR